MISETCSLNNGYWLLNSVCKFVRKHLCSSDSEKLIEFTHVNVSIFLSIFVVVIRVHSNANMDSRLLVLVFCQCVTIHIIAKVTLLLLLFTVVDDFELNRWHRFELLVVVVDLLERFGKRAPFPGPDFYRCRVIALDGEPGIGGPWYASD